MKIRETRLTLDDFRLKLQKVARWQLELAQLQDWVARLDVGDMAIASNVCFSSENYQRQILLRDSKIALFRACSLN